MKQPSTIRDCMRSNPLTVKSDLDLVKAIELIVENKLTGLSVVNDSGLAIGTLTELDCIRAILDSIYNNGDPGYIKVRDAMANEPLTCAPSDSIVEVAESMIKARQRRQAVVEDGKFIGQVSSNNILWALMEHSRKKR